jgi:hypothetical protein
MGQDLLGRRAVARWVSPLAVLAASAVAAPGAVFTFEPAAAPAPGCVSLQPEAPAPSVVDTGQYEGRGTRCASGISNGEGYVALRIDNSFGYPAQEKFWVVKPLWGGPAVGGFGVGENTFGEWRVTMFPQDHGWLTGQGTGEYDSTRVHGWSSTGALLSSISLPSAWPSVVVPDFTSGAVVTYESVDEARRLKVQRFNADGSPRSEAVDVAGAASGLVTAGVDDHRDVLVLFDGATVGLPAGHTAGRWLDSCGAALTEVFDTALPYSSGELVPLYDGSLVFQSGGQWVARFSHLSTAPAGPAPAWLAARPGTRLVWVGRGKGYALIPGGGEPQTPCRSQLFLFTKAGGFCGTATFTVDDFSCSPPELDVGPDGTVVQHSPRTGECTDPSCWYRFCSYTWWPNLLGGHGPRGQPGNGQRPPFGTRPIHCGQ